MSNGIAGIVAGKARTRGACGSPRWMIGAKPPETMHADRQGVAAARRPGRTGAVRKRA
jgi:hypothetical protein